MAAKLVVTEQPGSVTIVSQGPEPCATLKPNQQIIIITNFGPDPIHITCPSCKRQTITRVEYESTTHTHLMAALFCELGGICCCCIPYCTNNFKNANHYCALCGKYAGTFVAK